MTSLIPDADFSVLSRSNPDAIGVFDTGTATGRSTFLFGAINRTLYLDSRPRGTHNMVLHERPEIIEEIVPPDVFGSYQGGEFFDPKRGGRAWEVVAAYALLGRLGGVVTSGKHYNVVSIWPRSLAGIPGRLVPMPGLIERSLPGLLRALQGDGIIRSYGDPTTIDDGWTVVVEGELGPVRVGDYLNRIVAS